MKTKRVKYFPVSEVLTFSALSLLAWLILYYSNASPFLLCVIVPFIYITSMGRATIVHIDGDQLAITSLSIFMTSAQIDLKSVVNIQLHQSIEQETDVTYGGSFLCMTNITNYVSRIRKVKFQTYTFQLTTKAKKQ